MLDFILLTSLIFVLSWLMLSKESSTFPPGPIGIPLFGNLLQIGQRPYLTFANSFKKKYGEIVGLRLGSYRTVVISGYENVRQGLLEWKMSGRPNMPLWCVRSQDVVPRGIIFSEGDENAQQRRLALKAVKEFGYKNKALEDIMISEILQCVKCIDEKCEEPIKLRAFFNEYLFNVIWHIVAGRDSGVSRPKVAEIIKGSTEKLENNNMLQSLMVFMPWITTWFPKASGFEDMNGELEKIWALMDEQVSEHRKEYELHPSSFNDFIGNYLHEIHAAEQQGDKSSSFYGIVGEKNLRTSLIDFFFAGMDTIGTTLHWTLLLLAVHQDIQEKVVEEVNSKIGSSRLPEIKDEQELPYISAVVYEVLRYVTITPLAIFHSTLQGVEFKGYKIPKGTMIMFNMYDAHHDQGYWKDPEVFRPERFLNDDGHTLNKHSSAFFPFGLGKRICIGENLAKPMLFLFLSIIVQRFKVRLEKGNEAPSLDPIVGFVLLPPNHKLIFESRA